MLSFAFTSLVFFSATQGRWLLLDFLYVACIYLISLADIAVDGERIWNMMSTTAYSCPGWALTLLSEENLAYASTCQTIGLNTGYLLSYTVFLALNSEDFA